VRRADWRRILAAFGVLAVAWTIGGFVAFDQQGRIERHAKSLAASAARIKANNGRLAELTVNVTAALCLAEYAPERGPKAERTLAQRYVGGQTVPLTNEVCKQAVEKARLQLNP
jgi:hypothetical protein